VWNDRRLARRAARGDTDAFAAIFRRYQQDLYRYCVAILGNEQDAQDALQNTMVKALGALPGERRQIELKPWLYRVAHNESIDLRRRARPTAPLADEVPAPGVGPEQRAADRTQLRHLLADIAELPERHRSALVMRELAGLEFEEIGTALETSAGAARQVVYEARRGLQRMSDGREMTCDAVTAMVSDRDGRITRRREVRAHLRDCAECRRFADGIRGRREALAGIAPLPAVAAAAIAKGALAGIAGGGAAGGGAAGVAGGGAATGAGATAGGGAAGAAGVAGGAAAKLASTGAVLKSTAAIVAVVGVGAVAVDHGHLLHGGGSRANGDHDSATVARVPSGVTDGGAGDHAGQVDGSDAGALRRKNSEHRRDHAVATGLKQPVTQADAAAIGPSATGDAGANGNGLKAGRSVGDIAAGPIQDGAAAPHPESPHADHPPHPTHPTHPPDPAGPVANPAHPGQPDLPPPPTPTPGPADPPLPVRLGHSSHSDHQDDPARPEKSDDSSDSVKWASAEQPSTAAESAYPESSDRLKQPDRTGHPSHGWRSQGAAAAVEPGGDESGLEAETHPGRPSHPSPGAEEPSSVEYSPAPGEPAATGPTHADKEGTEEGPRR
jgi:RNA polymerase sigma factor (sigma-70 family)